MINPKLLIGGDWQTLEDEIGTFEYRYVTANIVHLRGNVSKPTSSSAEVTLPFTVTKQQIFICGGSSTYYTKVFINANSNIMGISTGTGVSSTTYNLNIYIDLKD